MRQTPNYDLNLFDATDEIEDDSRLAFNNNFDIIDAALKDASENGGIAVQDTQPTNDVLAWVDSDALGADFCFVGDTAPATDGTVAIWVDTSEDEIPVQSGAGGVSYDNTESGLSATNVQGAIDEITETESGTASMAGITWNRSGKVVAVSVKGTGLSSTSTTVTGLPTPKNPYLLSLLFYGNNMVGYLEYNNSNWSVRSVTGSGTSSYGSLTYIAD